MGRTRITLFRVAAMAAVAAGCARGQPPAELSGLWSAGPAACEAGVGVRFDENAIAAIYAGDRETLFESPAYEVEGEGEDFRVRIVYELPHRPGGARAVGAYGVLVLERGEAGGLAPVSHIMADRRTGSARVRVNEDPAFAALRLQPCGDHPWRELLRGRGDS